MNSRINVFGRTIPTWFLVATMVGAGSLAIATQGGAVHQEDPPDIQHSSDVKIHLQDVDGKVNTNVPVAASRAFSPLAIEFTADTDPTFANGEATGSVIATKQKVVINIVNHVANSDEIEFSIDNNSEDTQIFLIKASTPSNVILDAETVTNGTVIVHGVTGHNEWLASAGTGTKTFNLEVSMTDAGFYPIVVELLRVG